ncbi:hypothetical protein AVEN_257391-1 [Araneus ventricosus]|uniref:Uncharacterized protein n=1 Tax=Araneus ventricosus TaxID=182803 RepID=A0A4Y2CAR9_ARAVE|nr:hypothetical protein AVEN_257391-1 [Araneus ventricosus]
MTREFGYVRRHILRTTAIPGSHLLQTAARQRFELKDQISAVSARPDIHTGPNSIPSHAIWPSHPALTIAGRLYGASLRAPGECQRGHSDKTALTDRSVDKLPGRSYRIHHASNDQR